MSSRAPRAAPRRLSTSIARSALAGSARRSIAALARSQQDPSGGAVGVVDSQREADEIVKSGRNLGEVEPLDDADVGFEQGAVNRGAVVAAADGEVVDAHRRHADARPGPSPRRARGTCSRERSNRRASSARSCRCGTAAARRRRGRASSIASAVIVRASGSATTRAGPSRRPSGSSSIPGAPMMKCTGASTCVPVWTPRSSCVTVAGCPCSSACTRVTRTSGSPGQCTMPSRIGTVTSSQPPSSRGPGCAHDARSFDVAVPNRTTSLIPSLLDSSSGAASSGYRRVMKCRTLSGNRTTSASRRCMASK